MALSSSESIVEKPDDHIGGTAKATPEKGRQEKGIDNEAGRPTGLSLALIVLGICLALLCISLVCLGTPKSTACSSYP